MAPFVQQPIAIDVALELRNEVGWQVSKEIAGCGGTFGYFTQNVFLPFGKVFDISLIKIRNLFIVLSFIFLTTISILYTTFKSLNQTNFLILNQSNT